MYVNNSQMDMSIKYVMRVWHHIAPNWERKQFETRYSNGLLFVLKGRIECDFGTHKEIIKEGDIVKFPKLVPYSGKRITDDTVELIVIDFECFDNSEYERLNIPTVYRPKDVEYFKSLFYELKNVWDLKSPTLQLRAKGQLYNLIENILRDIFFAENSICSNILDYIYSNLSRSDLSCKEICEHFFISDSTLRRYIKSATGLSPKNYIHTQRMMLAKELLLYGTKKINEISELCGFCSPYYFSLAFKEVYGLSPYKHKKKYHVRA